MKTIQLTELSNITNSPDNLGKALDSTYWNEYIYGLNCPLDMLPQDPSYNLTVHIAFMVTYENIIAKNIEAEAHFINGKFYIKKIKSLFPYTPIVTAWKCDE